MKYGYYMKTYGNTYPTFGHGIIFTGSRVTQKGTYFGVGFGMVPV